MLCFIYIFRDNMGDDENHWKTSNSVFSAIKSSIFLWKEKHEKFYHTDGQIFFLEFFSATLKKTHKRTRKKNDWFLSYFCHHQKNKVFFFFLIFTNFAYFFSIGRENSLVTKWVILQLFFLDYLESNFDYFSQCFLVQVFSKNK